MPSKRCTPKVIFGLIDNRRKARFIFRENSSRRPPRGIPSSRARFATLDSGRLSFSSATAATLLLGGRGLNVATRRRVILVCPSLVATLAPRRRLQSDLSITRGGFARVSAAKVRPLSEKKNRDSVLFPAIPADSTLVAASHRSAEAIEKNFER